MATKPGTYRFADESRLSKLASDPPESDPPEKPSRPTKSKPDDFSIQPHQSGWRVTVPAVIVAALISAFGARLLPTATPTDSRIQQIQLDMQVAQLKDDQFREEVRRELAAIKDGVRDDSNSQSNRITQIEARLNTMSGRP